MTKEAIYAAAAAKFRKWGISAIPLHEYNNSGNDDQKANAKKPVIKNWQSFGRSLVSTTNLGKWCDAYPYNNLGITLGAEIIPDMQLVAIDIDDERFVEFVKATLGKVTCAKKGAKGLTIFALTSKEFKTRRLHISEDSENTGKPVVEILANRSQTVMPPSIHPSGIPYSYIDCLPLYEYEPQELPILTEEMLKLIEATISYNFITVLMGGEGSHDATLKLTGKLVALGISKELIIRSVPELFPQEYKGNTIEEIPRMIDDAIKNGFAEPKTSKFLDMQVAQELVAEHNPIVFVPGEGFLKYRNGHWPVYPDRKFDAVILGKLVGAPHKGFLAPIIKHVRLCTELLLQQEAFGSFSEYICCHNGAVNVLTGDLHEWSPEHQLRYQLDFEYDSEAKCPLYEEHLHRTLLGDQQAIDTFEEFAGYTLIPDNRMQKALYLVGEGGGGKSTLLRLVISMHDKRAVSVTSLTNIDNERHITDLANKLLCISMDIQPKDKAVAYGEGFIRITGGDPITTRKLFNEVKGNVQTLVRFMGSMNKLPPKFIAAPDALKRRLIFLPCGGKIDKPDSDFFNKLLAERPGILARWVKALQRLMLRGNFTSPESSRQMVEQYLETQDPVQCFINECLEVDEEAETPVAELFMGYCQWAERNLEPKFSKNTFGKHLRDCGLQQAFRKMPMPGKRHRTVRIYRVEFLPECKPVIGLY